MSLPACWSRLCVSTVSTMALASTLLAACGTDTRVGAADRGTPGGAERSPGPAGATAGDASSGPGGTGTLGGASGTAGGGAAAGTTALAGGAGAPGAGGAPAGSTTVAEPVVIDDCGSANPGRLGTAQVELLKAGGAANGTRILYPYDGTVFPRGLGAPPIMWDGGSAVQALYVHVKAKLFEYHGCHVPSANGRLQLPQAVWDKAGEQARGALDPFTFEVTTLSGQQAAGPLKQTFVIAQATLKGSIYYNSYNSQLSGGGLLQDGAILRLRPGSEAELFLRRGTCTGCHSVSANGQRLVAKEIGPLAGGGGGLLGGGPGGGFPDGAIYSLAENTPTNPQPMRAGPATAFTGLTPNGKYYLSSAGALGLGPRLEGLGQAFADARLFETDSGALVANTGIPTGAMMPSFSADGKLLTFSDLGANGRGISVMDFDPETGKAQNARSVFSNSQSLAGWPFVLPDNRAVVFALGTANDYSGLGAGIDFDLSFGPVSELMIVDLGSGRSTLLARAMGYHTAADAQQGKTYLPFGSEELRRSYYPTVSPVAGGGYFWIFFDSVRRYGNQGLRRQLWGAAIAVRGAAAELVADDYSEDPSFPAFYLPGQELPVANHRAFTALDPCRPDGASCETGIDCCSGFCTNGICGVETPRCAMTNEACKTDKDCCNYPQDFCIAGFCGPIPLQ